MTPRTHRLSLALLATLALPLAPAQAQSTDTAAYLEEVRAQFNLPALAAAVTLDGVVVDAAAVGLRASTMDVPVTVNDRFHIGSDAKAMTATLVGMMIEGGKLDWKSTIGQVLGADVPGMNPALAAVTLEQLMSHSSGIPTDTPEMIDLYFNVDAFDFNSPELRLKALTAWRDNAPVVPDGSPFQYANFGYMIVGMMVEKVAGTPWETLIHERIFTPMGLETAGIGPQATTGLVDAAVGHQVAPDGSFLPMFWGAAASTPMLLAPAGDVHMSILDFATWAAWNAAEGDLGPALVTPETLKTLHSPHVKTPHRENPPAGTPQDGEYGFGWGIVEFDWADHPMLTHNGSNGMNLAKILLDPSISLSVVAITNAGGADADIATGAVLEHLYQAFRPAP